MRSATLGAQQGLAALQRRVFDGLVVEAVEDLASHSAPYKSPGKKRRHATVIAALAAR